MGQLEENPVLVQSVPAFAASVGRTVTSKTVRKLPKASVRMSARRRSVPEDESLVSLCRGIARFCRFMHQCGSCNVSSRRLGEREQHEAREGRQCPACLYHTHRVHEFSWTCAAQSTTIGVNEYVRDLSTIKTVAPEPRVFQAWTCSVQRSRARHPGTFRLVSRHKGFPKATTNVTRW